MGAGVAETGSGQRIIIVINYDAGAVMVIC